MADGLKWYVNNYLKILFWSWNRWVLVDVVIVGGLGSYHYAHEAAPCTESCSWSYEWIVMVLASLQWLSWILFYYWMNFRVFCFRRMIHRRGFITFHWWHWVCHPTSLLQFVFVVYIKRASSNSCNYNNKSMAVHWIGVRQIRRKGKIYFKNIDISFPTWKHDLIFAETQL